MLELGRLKIKFLKKIFHEKFSTLLKQFYRDMMNILVKKNLFFS